MHRGPYNQIPANSPPLHHPVPQHVSTVPQLRSPPPPTPQQSQPQSHHGYTPQGQQPGQQGQMGGQFGYPNAFADFANDPTAQMGIQVTKHALAAGNTYIGGFMSRYVDILALKHLFNVSNSYVLTKISIVLFPWRHRPWSRQQRLSPTDSQSSEFAPPREDINAPDLYIPTMAFVTYILLNAVLAGVKGTYHPRLLSGNFGTTATVLVVEFIFLKAACYFLSIRSSAPSPSAVNSQWLELIAYSGYKFIGIIVTILLTSIFSSSTHSTNGGWSWIAWSIFAYCYLANGLFYLRSLRWMLLPDAGSGNQWGAPSATNQGSRTQKATRTQFLFVHSYVMQFLFMWILTR